jgi:5-formyltetrahydrofolate cyclo-ligase
MDEASLSAAKQAARRLARQRRSLIPPDQAARAALQIADRIADRWSLDSGPVAGYWPLSGEIDPRPLLVRCPIAALPVMQGPGLPLLFRRWRQGDPLQTAAFGVQEPGPEAELVRPFLLLLPLLAFDRRGGRLGYGGGFYDRTLAALRSAFRADGAPVIAIGIGFAQQEVPEVPTGPADMPLDAVVTEAETLDFREG